METNIYDSVLELAKLARAASAKLATTTEAERNAALHSMASALRRDAAAIIAANEEDMAAAREGGTEESLLDRLMLNNERIEDMASALEDLADLEDPVGKVQCSSTMYNGIKLTRVSVPLGVVAIIYEARPNVTADAAGICVKSGNACILRGGSLAARTNEVMSNILADAATSAGLPVNCICAITTTDRAATDALMQLHGIVDVIIPRGGAGLIKHCVEYSKVPVIETGTGNCHVYVHESADKQMAHNIVMNAKCRRYGVCNAAETMLVDSSIAEQFLPEILKSLADKGVLLHLDEQAAKVAESIGLSSSQWMLATEHDWETEYLGPEIAVRCVDGVDEAIDHVNKYGTKHSESIVAKDEEACEKFLRGVDAAAVYSNASTAFTDGGQFGLGAEIGISTQKLHARGPFALDALTSYKYVLRGEGQVRS